MERRDIVPRDQRSRDPVDELRCEPGDAEPAEQAADADVGGDDAQRTGGPRDLDVVDADELAAVDVDDLLVEEIFDKVQRFVIGRPDDRGSFLEHETRGVERGEVADRRGQLAVLGLHDDGVDVGEGVLRALDHEIRDAAHQPSNAVALDEYRAADELRDEAVVEWYRLVGACCRHVASPFSISAEKSRSGCPSGRSMTHAAKAIRPMPPQRRASAPRAVDQRTSSPVSRVKRRLDSAEPGHHVGVSRPFRAAAVYACGRLA